MPAAHEVHALSERSIAPAETGSSTSGAELAPGPTSIPLVVDGFAAVLSGARIRARQPPHLEPARFVIRFALHDAAGRVGSLLDVRAQVTRDLRLARVELLRSPAQAPCLFPPRDEHEHKQLLASMHPEQLLLDDPSGLRRKCATADADADVDDDVDVDADATADAASQRRYVDWHARCMLAAVRAALPRWLPAGPTGGDLMCAEQAYTRLQARTVHVVTAGTTWRGVRCKLLNEVGAATACVRGPA